jgi:hypothetical protein
LLAAAPQPQSRNSIDITESPARLPQPPKGTWPQQTTADGAAPGQAAESPGQASPPIETSASSKPSPALAAIPLGFTPKPSGSVEGHTASSTSPLPASGLPSPRRGPPSGPASPTWARLNGPVSPTWNLQGGTLQGSRPSTALPKLVSSGLARVPPDLIGAPGRQPQPSAAFVGVPVEPSPPASKLPFGTQPLPAHTANRFGSMGNPRGLGPPAPPASGPTSSSVPLRANSSFSPSAAPSLSVSLSSDAASSLLSTTSSLPQKVIPSIKFRPSTAVPIQPVELEPDTALPPAACPPQLPQVPLRFLMANQTESIPLGLVTQLGLPLCVPARLGNTTVCIPVTEASGEGGSASAFNTSAGIAIATQQPLTLVPLEDLAPADSPPVLPNGTVCTSRFR